MFQNDRQKLIDDLLDVLAEYSAEFDDEGSFAEYYNIDDTEVRILLKAARCLSELET